MAAWLLLIFLICLHNQLRSIHSIPRIKEYRCLKNVIHHIDSKNERSLLSASFTAKLELPFVLTPESVFFRGFISKQTGRAQVPLKSGTRDFQNSLRLRDRHVFIRQSVEILNIFNTITLKQTFWKTKAFFRKLEHRFLVESTKTENASFPYKTVISEANIKTNGMVSAKWTFHEERCFSSNYNIFLKILFQFKNPL